MIVIYLRDWKCNPPHHPSANKCVLRLKRDRWVTDVRAYLRFIFCTFKKICYIYPPDRLHKHTFSFSLLFSFSSTMSSSSGLLPPTLLLWLSNILLLPIKHTHTHAWTHTYHSKFCSILDSKTLSHFFTGPQKYKCAKQKHTEKNIVLNSFILKFDDAPSSLKSSYSTQSPNLMHMNISGLLVKKRTCIHPDWSVIQDIIN